MWMGDATGDQQMKEFINVTDELLACYANVTRPELMLVENIVENDVSVEHPIISECRDLVFKLQTFMEDSAGDYALGVETGMQRAAEMIGNLIKRHEKGDDLEHE
jgi:hypothetical protein